MLLNWKHTACPESPTFGAGPCRQPPFSRGIGFPLKSCELHAARFLPQVAPQPYKVQALRHLPTPSYRHSPPCPSVAISALRAIYPRKPAPRTSSICSKEEAGCQGAAVTARPPGSQWKAHTCLCLTVLFCTGSDVNEMEAERE